MSVVRVDIVRSVPKECHDIFVLVGKILVTIKSKGDYSALIGDLVKAVDGVSYVSEELKEAALEVAADGVNEILAAIQAMKNVPTV